VSLERWLTTLLDYVQSAVKLAQLYADPRQDWNDIAAEERSGLKAGTRLARAAQRLSCLAAVGGKVRTVKKRKKSTARGEGQIKLIAALTKHHQYADGGCLKQEPISINQLAKLAKVSPSTAWEFIKKEFQGQKNYQALCDDKDMLLWALKVLNEEFAPYHLLGDSSSNLTAPTEEDTDAE
jgi:hypothetical protein